MALRMGFLTVCPLSSIVIYLDLLVCEHILFIFLLSNAIVVKPVCIVLHFLGFLSFKERAPRMMYVKDNLQEIEGL